MGAVTYPETDVVEFINQNFCALKVNVTDPGSDGSVLLRCHRLLWEPGLVVMDHRETEVMRWIGYLPPKAFIGQLSIALGKVSSLYSRQREALDWFSAAANCGERDLEAESLYWAGITEYRIQGGDKSVLQEKWRVLQADYSDTSWWQRADVF